MNFLNDSFGAIWGHPIPFTMQQGISEIRPEHFFKIFFQYPRCCQKSGFKTNDLPAAPGRESVVQGGGNTYGQIAGINTVILVQTPCR